MTKVEFYQSNTLIDYQQALDRMEKRVDDILKDRAPELVWFLEHPPIYTAGTSANANDLLNQTFPVYYTGRGGQFTYHGPGQRIVYVLLNLKKRKQQDLRYFVCQLESWLINSLKHFGINGERRDGRVGIWVPQPNQQEKKIAAIGVRVRKWVTFHGIALNVHTDLSHYDGIVPCGIKEYGITSMAKLLEDINIEEVDKVLKETFKKTFLLQN